MDHVGDVDWGWDENKFVIKIFLKLSEKGEVQSQFFVNLVGGEAGIECGLEYIPHYPSQAQAVLWIMWPFWC